MSSRVAPLPAMDSEGQQRRADWLWVGSFQHGDDHPWRLDFGLLFKPLELAIFVNRFVTFQHNDLSPYAADFDRNDVISLLNSASISNIAVNLAKALRPKLPRLLTPGIQ